MIRPVRYNLGAVIAAYSLATQSICAQNGIPDPNRPKGYPLPS
jgi:hypothetical protein